MKISKIIAFGQILETIRFGSKLSKNFYFFEIFENCWFYSNFPKISILVKIFEKTSILVKISINFDIFANSVKFRF